VVVVVVLLGFAAVDLVLVLLVVCDWTIPLYVIAAALADEDELCTWF
jgi:phage shock protein PspC (stress-responsive transcriptional regulator)